MATAKKPPMPSPSVPDDLATIRETIATTKAELAALARAPVPLDDAEAALVAGIDRLASLYDPDAILRSFTREGGADLETVRLLFGDPRFDVQRVHAFLATVFSDQLLATWRTRLRALYRADAELVRAAIPLRERPARIAQLQERLRALEMQEERTICAAEGRGERIDRRADADPAVLFADEVLAEGAAP